MRESERSTTWTCDGKCDPETGSATEVLTGGYQDTPPKDWRILHVLPSTLNMALEAPGGIRDHKVIVLCGNCFDQFTCFLAGGAL